MPRRASSPALSDGGVDIGDSLFAQDATSEGGRQAPQEEDFDMDGILNGGDDNDDDDDEAFIALQQAASNRKASNLKGSNATLPVCVSLRKHFKKRLFVFFIFSI